MSSQKSLPAPVFAVAVLVGVGLGAILIAATKQQDSEPSTPVSATKQRDSEPSTPVSATKQRDSEQPSYLIPPSELTDSTEFGERAKPPTSNGFHFIQATRKRIGKIWDRVELEAALKDTTHAEVKALLGLPDSEVHHTRKARTDRNDLMWRYFNILIDPKTGKRDSRAYVAVWFETDDDRVARLDFMN